MMNVFVKKSAEEVCVQLSDGRLMSLKDLVKDYEKLLREKNSKEEISKKVLTSELKVGEWFFFDRDVIEKNREKIDCVCGEERDRYGKLYRERFQKSNEIADAEPERYPRRGWTYVFKHEREEYKTEQEMRDMCKEIGDGMCDEVICDFELQMRICNGESTDDLFQKADKLPHVRVIQLRNGRTGYFGGGADSNFDYPPADLRRDYFVPDFLSCKITPYAFRRELS